MSDNTQRKLHIAFASAEAAPFVKTGGLGDVAGSLPQALKAAGAEVVVLVPKYDTIAQEYKDRMEHLSDFYVPLGWRNEYCGLERLSWGGVDYLFVDNERYFSRGYPYGFFDDGERFAFFSKAVVEALQYLPYALNDFTCDVLHCNDWHTAMAPVFLREFYQALPLYQNVKCVFSIHNIAFQGQFTSKILNDILGLAHIPAAAFQLTAGPDAINYMQGALNYTDSITTVSPTYAEEIKTAEYGEHLDGILRRRAPILQGIVNGIDTKGFDPATDPRIAANFTREDRSGKAVCKAELQRELGLEVRDDRPLMVMVTRLTRQKGMDLVTYALDRILSGGVQVAVLGTGDTEYENALRYFEGKYPGTMAARIQFDPALSQRMYAGADLFLMPSLFEPCGLSQMIAMRYGTLPVVRETGGLRDTVVPYNQFTGEGTGFSFANFNGDEMADAVFRAARLFWDDRGAFDHLVDNAMAADFSWKHSAEAYLGLYHNLHPEIPLPVVEEEAAPVEAAADTAPVEAAAPAVDEKAAPSVEAPATEKVDDPAAVPATPVTEQLPLDDTPAAAPVAAEPAKKAPAKKPAAKKTAVKKTTVKAAEADEAEPVAEKPATAKKAPAKKTATRKAAATKTATAKSVTATETTTAKAAAAKAAPTAKVTAAKATTATKAASTKAPAAKPATAKTSTAKSAAAKATTTKPEAATPAAAVKAPAAKTSAAKTVAAKATTAKTTTAKTAVTKPAATTTTATVKTAEAAPTKKTATTTATKSTAAKTMAAKAAAPQATAAKAAASPAAEVKATATAKAATTKTTVAKTAAAKTATPASKATAATKAAAAAKIAAEPAAKAEAPAKKTVSKMVPKVSRAKRK